MSTELKCSYRDMSSTPVLKEVPPDKDLVASLEPF